MLQPFLYQDNVLRISNNHESLVYGNAIIDHNMNEKNLQLNIDKSNYMIIGSEKNTNRFRVSLLNKSIILGGNPISDSQVEKYLVDYFHHSGNEQSIVTTIKRKYGR